MLTIDERDTFIVIVASGTLTRKDYDRFVPSFDGIVRKRDGEPVPMLIDATAFEGWNAAGLWQDLKFDTTHQDTLGPMAIVGDERWQEWETRLSKPFFKAEMRFFHPHEKADALRWLEEASRALR